MPVTGGPWVATQSLPVAHPHTTSHNAVGASDQSLRNLDATRLVPSLGSERLRCTQHPAQPMSVSSSRSFLTPFSCQAVSFSRGLGGARVLGRMWPQPSSARDVAWGCRVGLPLLPLPRLPPSPQMSLCLATGATVGCWHGANRQPRSERDLEPPPPRANSIIN